MPRRPADGETANSGASEPGPGAATRDYVGSFSRCRAETRADP